MAAKLTAIILPPNVPRQSRVSRLLDCKIYGIAAYRSFRRVFSLHIFVLQTVIKKLVIWFGVKIIKKKIGNISETQISIKKMLW